MRFVPGGQRGIGDNGANAGQVRGGEDVAVRLDDGGDTGMGEGAEDEGQFSHPGQPFVGDELAFAAQEFGQEDDITVLTLHRVVHA